VTYLWPSRPVLAFRLLHPLPSSRVVANAPWTSDLEAQQLPLESYGMLVPNDEGE
jgi:hypothetical protein